MKISFRRAPKQLQRRAVSPFNTTALSLRYASSPPPPSPHILQSDVQDLIYITNVCLLVSLSLSL